MGVTDHPSVHDIAAFWFARLRDEDVSDLDRARFQAWLEADSGHAEAYADLERVWAGFDLIDHDDQRLPATRQIRAARWRDAGVFRYAAAASVALVVAVGAYGASGPGLFADHATGVGEQREVFLQDGSVVHLNTDTALSVDFAEASRVITLHAGEAFFKVTTDPDRPFIVMAGGGRAEALGTAFLVENFEDHVGVRVTESRVEVAADDGTSVILSDGEGVVLTDAGLEAVTTGHDDALAWLEGRMIFENRPLGDVLEELDRYRRGRIVVLDDITRAMPVTGSFSVTDTDDTLDTIERTLPIKVRRLSDFLVLVGAV